MPGTFFTNISRIGLDQIQDTLEYRRSLLVNNLSVINVLICLSVSILLFIEGLSPQNVIVLGGAILFLLVLYLNKRKKHGLARTYFIFLSIILLFSASLIAYEQSRFNDVENILIGYMAVAFFMYDGVLRYISYISIFFLLLVLKFIKQSYLGLPIDFNFYLTIQNFAILGLMVFLFCRAFRLSMMKAFLKVKNQETVLYSLIDNVPLFIGLVDNEFRYKMVNINYEKAFGKKRNEIIGKKVDEILPPNILESHMPMLEKVLHGESQDFLEKTEMPDGTAFYASGKYVPLRDEHDEIVGTTVYVDDVTKLEEAKINLKKANDSKDRLFSIVAHDIRGPFNLLESILNYSTEDLITKEEYFKYLNSVRSKLETMKSTVNTLLDWARSQLDGVTTNPSTVKISEVLEEEIELYRSLLSKKKIDIQYEIDERTAVWMDENHLKIAMRNLIHNAIKFTGEGGVIKLLVEQQNGQVHVQIADSGIGMSVDKIQSILNKELQKSNAGTMGEGGSGIGLSLSLALLEKNQCDIDLRSTPEKGTTFEILIPSA